MSLKIKLTLAAIASAVLALLIGSVATYSLTKSYLVRQIDNSLLTAEQPLVNLLDEGVTLTFEQVARLAPGMFIQVRNENEQVIVSISAFAQGGVLLNPNLPTKITFPSNSATTFFYASSRNSSANGFRVLAESLVNGYTLILAYPLNQLNDTLTHLLESEIIIIVIALAFASLFSIVLVSRSLRPLRRFEQTTSRVASGILSERFEVTSNDEIGNLGRSFNAMISQIEYAFTEKSLSEKRLQESNDRTKRFLADASHELRTPISALAAYGELLSRVNSALDKKDAMRVVEGIRRESFRAARLVDELLTLARLDEQASNSLEVTNLSTIIEQQIETFKMTNPNWNVTFLKTTDGPALINQDYIRRIFDNLFNNSLNYASENKTIVISLDESVDQIIMTFCDNGPGVPHDELDHLFERFYRVEKSRSRESGGSGLGLSIVKVLVDRQNASIFLKNGHLFVYNGKKITQNGLCVTIVFPRYTSIPGDLVD